MGSKIILVSFADSRYKNSLERLKKQTEGFPFDERYFLTEKTALTPEYWRRLKPWLYRRGYGYWAWKATIIKDYFDKLSFGDYLFWSDSGISWNSDGEAFNRFREYVAMLDGDKSILTFQQTTPEQEYSKGDALQALGVYDNAEVCTSFQLWAGCFLMKKTTETVAFLDRWIELNELSRELITDKASVVPNKSGFKEHRHDQSLFSLLTKQYPHVEISYKEIQPEDGDWDKLKTFPIHAKRLKEQDRPKSEVIKNKLLRPWREILHIYFKYIRKYEYRGKYVW